MRNSHLLGKAFSLIYTGCSLVPVQAISLVTSDTNPCDTNFKQSLDQKAIAMKYDDLSDDI